jgi:hypothetical protein
VFTGALVGTATIHAVSGILPTTNSGLITVVAGAASQVRVETAADGTGVLVPAQSVASGSTLTVYSITRDAAGNFLANLAADAWSLDNKTGGVVDADLVPAGDSKSAVFTGALVGTAKITATSGALTPVSSGLITVVPGTLDHFVVEADGGGNIATPQAHNLPFPIQITARDAAGNVATSFDGSTATITASDPNSADISVSNGGTTAAFSNGIVTGHSITLLANAIGTTQLTATGGGKTGTSNVFTVHP